MMTKKEIRRIANENRKAMPPGEEEEKSRKICEQILSLPEYKEARSLYCYVDFNHEVRTWDIMENAIAEGKRVAVPRVDGDSMDFYYITSREDLEPGCLGILEPKAGLSMAAEEEAFFLMPGVAFDRDHHRVGYGGGYYDRYLERFPKLTKVAVAYECQVFDQVPHETFDICPTVLVTEAGISRK